MTKFGIGQPVRRVEDQRFLTGRGRYVDDINLAHQAYGALVLSPHAHARIVGVDTTAAAASPGVLCVLTGADVVAEKLGGFTSFLMPEDLGAPKGHRTFWPVLSSDRVRCVGDRVAFVVAATPEEARDAAELVAVTYETLPSVTHLDDAAADGASKVWEDCPNGNVAFGIMFGDAAATDTAFATAAHTVSLRLENNRVSANSMEPRGAIGDYDAGDESYTLYTSTQNPHGVRQEGSHVLHVPETRIRVVAPDVGGGFGMKAEAFPEEMLVLWASRKCGRPVKWIANRSESLMSDVHGRDQIIFGEMALDADGRILAIRAQARHAVGAYFIGAGLVPTVFAMRFIPGPYDVQAIHVMAQGLFTNTSPIGPYRGAGRPEAVYVTERLLDQAARLIGIDRDEIRRRNLIPMERLPYTTQTHYSYDSGEFHRLMALCMERADWPGYAARRAASDAAGKLRGRAITYYIEQGGVFNERMELRFDPGGSVTIVAGTFSHGQGHATTFAQMVSDWLAVPFETIRFVQGDTDKVPFGRGTYAARSSMLGGCALRAAADVVIEKARHMAAALMEAAAEDVEFAEGAFRIAGTDRAMTMTDVAKAFYYPMGITDKFGVGLEGSGTFTTEPPNHPNGCHVCELEIDPQTGAVAIDRYTIVDDVGIVINPLICAGQVHGGLAQGIGQALLEHALYDRASGQLLSGSFMDYGMPRADMFPDFKTRFEEIPATTNPLGIKGIGEAGAIGAPATIVNAIIDALTPLGIAHIDMPATPGKIWESVQRATA